MISTMAKDDMDELTAKGVSLTPEEIITLNDLALDVEAAEDSADLYAAPRCAFLGDVVFREPTLGHSVWLEKIFPRISGDAAYIIACAYALTQEADALVDPLAPAKTIRKAVDDYTKGKLDRFTAAQISNAVHYCLVGTSAIVDTEPDKVEGVKVRRENCAFGLLLQGVALGVRLPLAELKTLTRGQMIRLMHLAANKSGMALKGEKGERLGRYFKYLDSIAKRKAA